MKDNRMQGWNGVKQMPLVIAEIGINHNGDIAIAKQLIDLAKGAGCDVVKFQKRTIDVVYTQELLAQHRESPWGDTQRAQKEGLEFGKKEYDEINRYCQEVGIDWFASAWDVESQRFIRQYDLKYNKVASAMLTHVPLLREIASENKHTFVSTGMSSLDDVDRAIDIFKEYDCDYSLLHCCSLYPCPDELSNIRCIQRLKEKYTCHIGYSGHEVGIVPTVVAVVLGASIIERHITLDRAMYGSDQSASLERRGLELVVKYSKAIPSILGDGEKALSDAELAVQTKLRYFKVQTEEESVIRPEIIEQAPTTGKKHQKEDVQVVGAEQKD